MTEQQKRRMNDLLEAKRQRELEPDEVAPAASSVLTDEQIAEISRGHRSANGMILMDVSFARAIEAEVLAQAGKGAADEIAALHRQLAAEKLRADQGWERAEAKSSECIELRERMAGAQAGVRAEPAAPPLTAPAPLTDELRKVVNAHCNDLLDCAVILHDDGRFKNTAAEIRTAVSELRAAVKAAPAPQQSEGLSDERITEISRAHRNANGMLLMDISFARAIEREVVKAAPAAPVQTGTPVIFMGVDPLEIAKGATLPMVPASWRFGFYSSNGELRFGYQDNGPLVAWDAVKDAIDGSTAPTASTAPEGKEAIAILRRAMTKAGIHDVARGMLTIHFSNEWNKSIARPAPACGQCFGKGVMPTIGEVCEVCNGSGKALAAPVQAEQAQAEPVARLQAEVSDRPFSEGETFFEVVILDRTRAVDGMELYAAPVAALPAQAEQAAAVRAATFDEVIRHFQADVFDQAKVAMVISEVRALATKEAATQVPAAEWVNADDAKTLRDAAGILERESYRMHAMALRSMANRAAAPSTATSNDTGALGDTGGEA